MSVTERIDLGIVTFEPFPIGMAGTNRIVSWASVLAARGISVKVYIVKPTENINNICNRLAAGTYKGIKYEYVNNMTIWPKHKSKFHRFQLLLVCYYKIIRHLIHEKPPIISTYTSDICTKIILLILRPLLNFKIIIEETEYPKILKKKTGKLCRNLYLRLYQYSDGMLVMTKELYTYYQKLGVKRILLLPMTVDSSRFSTLSRKNTEQKYFIYVGGSGGFSRDGIMDIAKAFHLFSINDSTFSLLIVGPVDKVSESYQKLIGFIAENKLFEKVIFTGSKPAHEIPDLLANATGIIMAPPHDFTTGGFPTKLGEFLASGTPVICTRVSDIPVYLNETNSFLVSAGDSMAISKAMEYIVKMPEKSYAIGQKGKELANDAFNAQSYIESLLPFFELNLI